MPDLLRGLKNALEVAKPHGVASFKSLPYLVGLLICSAMTRVLPLLQCPCNLCVNKGSSDYQQWVSLGAPGRRPPPTPNAALLIQGRRYQ